MAKKNNFSADWPHLERIPQKEGETREEYIQRVSALAVGISHRRIAASNKVMYFVVHTTRGFFQHWLGLVNFFNGLILGGALLGPLLHSLGQHEIANRIFSAFSILCVQVPSHSYTPFGYQMCVCQRCTAIYATALFGGLVYAALRRQRYIRPLKWVPFFVFCLPIALDALTQSFGWRDSNWMLRTYTGLVFAIGVMWLCYPHFDLAIKQHLKLDLGLAADWVRSPHNSRIVSH